MSRVKHALGHWLKQAAQGDSKARRHARSCAATGARAANHKAVFAMPEMPVRPDSAALKAAPLRIVRESDNALGVECAGRMVISGRMADVCAELDRMALRAAAAQDSLVANKP